ncbi:MAG: membrane protein insertion efficiency factor YidD [Leptolyngbyaceae cyanobacterium RM1_1_2]|nr:membrane protein insertion efficiency factor YidD [Leptolyngbyaceae cyanobacterium RM1_1_2]
MQSDLDWLARQGAIAAIDTYQRALSPHKGFACPHRLLYGRESCSDYARQLLHNQSLLQAAKTLPQRFRLCQQAAQQLQASQYQQSNSGCIVIPCCLPL